MNYLANPDISEKIDEHETDPLTGNIIGAAIDVDRAILRKVSFKLNY